MWGLPPVDYYVRRVWEKAQIRKLKAKAKQIHDETPDGNLSEYFNWVESQIFEITRQALDRDSFPPLTSTAITPVSECLKNPPPPRDYLFEEVLPAKIVAAIIAIGGTGKGYLNTMLGLSLATGLKVGPLKPAKSLKTLYLGGEDSQEELETRKSDYLKITPKRKFASKKRLVLVIKLGERGPQNHFSSAVVKAAA